jgi:hypothetical protein
MMGMQGWLDGACQRQNANHDAACERAGIDELPPAMFERPCIDSPSAGTIERRVM